MISIIGNGFVGNAIYQVMKDHYDIAVYDIDDSKSLNTFEQANSNKVVFICVPTPMTQSGAFDVSILTASISKLSPGKILLIKSTITPDYAVGLAEHFPQHSFVFNPEFLSERTAVEDFRNQKRIVLGGHWSFVNIAESIYRKVFPNVEYIKTDVSTACFIKYFCNCFYAAKISMMNEFRQIADASGVDWDTALNGMLSSGWVNPMHTIVPGTDGHFGFGGKCFPKDINAFMSFCERHNIDPVMLRSSWETNLKVRKDKNWTQIKGAVSDE